MLARTHARSSAPPSPPCSMTSPKHQTNCVCVAFRCSYAWGALMANQFGGDRNVPVGGWVGRRCRRGRGWVGAWPAARRSLCAPCCARVPVLRPSLPARLPCGVSDGPEHPRPRLPPSAATVRPQSTSQSTNHVLSFLVGYFQARSDGKSLLDRWSSAATSQSATFVSNHLINSCSF